MTWMENVAPIIAKLEVAAKFSERAVFSCHGSAALALLLRDMARLLDEEVVKRKEDAR